MIVRIHHCRNRYQIAGDPSSADAISLRCEQILRENLVDIRRDTMVADTDVAVWVIRRVRVRTRLDEIDAQGDAEIGRHLTESLSQAVDTHLTDHRNDSQEVMRFADQAEYVACFVGDLLRDRAWDQWYYGAFRALRERNSEDAIFSVLMESREHLSEILARLYNDDLLDSLFETLGKSAISRLCTLVAGRQSATWVLRPVFDVVFRIADRCGWWQGNRPDQQHAQAVYSARVQVDSWDRATMTRTAVEIIGFFLQRRHLHRSAVAHTVAESSTLHAVIGDVDWLDADVLQDGIHKMLRDGVPTSTGTNGRDALRPIFASALRVAQRLAPALSSTSAEKAFEHYLASNPKQPNWKDPTSLAMAVADAIRCLLDERHLQHMSNVSASIIDAALSDESWLDRGELRRLLLDRINPESALNQKGQSSQTEQSLSQRYVELLKDIAAEFEHAARGMNRRSPDSSENFLRFHTMLVTRNASWSNEPLAVQIIETLLCAWQHLVDSGQLGSGDDVPGLSTLIDVARSDPSIAQRQSKQVLNVFDAHARKSPGLIQASDDSPRHQQHEGLAEFETHCVAAFLLVRAIQDLRLAGMVEGLDLPAFNSVAAWQALLIGLGLRWSGVDVREDDSIDPGLLLLAGAEPSLTGRQLAGFWKQLTEADFAGLQIAMLRRLAGHRLIGDGKFLYLHRLSVSDGGTAWVGGDDAAGIWPLARIDMSPSEEPATFLIEWVSAWEEVFGQRPKIIVAEEIAAIAARSLADVDAPIIQARFENLACSENGDSHALDCDEELSHYYDGSRELAVLPDVYGAGRLDVAEIDLYAPLLAAAVVRAWARWLRQFARSSHKYLLSKLVRRNGSVTINPSDIVVEMEPLPLDIVLNMAGYMNDIDSVPWLGGRAIRFRVRE